ncbi:unnamed protein product [Boreogadus saida]
MSQTGQRRRKRRRTEPPLRYPAGRPGGQSGNHAGWPQPYRGQRSARRCWNYELAFGPRRTDLALTLDTDGSPGGRQHFYRHIAPVCGVAEIQPSLLSRLIPSYLSLESGSGRETSHHSVVNAETDAGACVNDSLSPRTSAGSTQPATACR